MGETELAISFVQLLAHQYPWFGSLIFCLGILWLILICLLNIIDGLIYVFQWNEKNKYVGMFRRFCERFGPSLSIFAKESKEKLATKQRNKKP